LIFLPITFIVYFALHYAKKDTLAKIWLVGASLFFYSFWNIRYLPLILVSTLVNFIVGTYLANSESQTVKKRKSILAIGVIFNVALLGYYKYTDFFLSTINTLFDQNLGLLHLALPLAISFFTFEQIIYLVDSYRGETKEYDLLDYSLFVTFFPKLIAGPIVFHNEMIPQFKSDEKKAINWQNISLGLFIFGVGLFKKVMIADTFSIWANNGYNHAFDLNFVESWITSLSYTFQLYFDFSGYCDMATGAALLLNINLHINFNSPYKALNIQDFWRRWHITLGRFLTRYLYFPLGGNRKGRMRTYINIMIIFLVSGFWHGAGWTFIFWGFLHGVASVIYRWWKERGYKMPKFLAWFITFQFVNMAWVFFRAENFAQALAVLQSMVGINSLELPTRLARVVEPILHVNLMPDGPWLFTYSSVLLIVIALVVVVFRKNSFEMMEFFKPNTYHLTFMLIITIVSILQLGKVSEFLYFNF
jgi:D-alanyl-lipoteichoic acid acyltransferase DltB (MBOAT superfamily)